MALGRQPAWPAPLEPLNLSLTRRALNFADSPEQCGVDGDLGSPAARFCGRRLGGDRWHTSYNSAQALRAADLMAKRGPGRGPRSLFFLACGASTTPRCQPRARA